MTRLIYRQDAGNNNSTLRTPRVIRFPYRNGDLEDVSIGSRSNVSDNAAEANRARIFEFNPDGTGQKVYAWGIRNAVGLAFRPGTNELWMSTNERDELGDNLVPDYQAHSAALNLCFYDGHQFPEEYRGDILPPSTVLGTVAGAPVTKSCACQVGVTVAKAEACSSARMATARFGG